MPRWQRTLSVGVKIPTASMADIAFLLIIFYMSTTIFRMENGLPVNLPKADAAQRMARERLVHVWVGRDGAMTIADRAVTFEGITSVIANRLREDPGLTVALDADGDVPCRVISRVLASLQNAGAFSISFSSEPEPR